MYFRIAADAVVFLHLLFIAFVVAGGFLVIRWRWLFALHVPALTWGAVVEFFHLYCPLTPLENSLRLSAGDRGYNGGFIEHHLIPLIYPAGLTPQTQVLLGLVVVLVNAGVYGWLLRSYVSKRKAL